MAPYEQEKCRIIGKIVKMERGVMYTGVWIKGEDSISTLEHYILVENITAERDLKMGMEIRLKLEEVLV
jgi:hypothetical protein